MNQKVIVLFFLVVLGLNYWFYAYRCDDDNFDGLPQFLNFDISATSANSCEVIHIGFVASGLKANIQLYPVLKSIFFYRINPLHFHIFVDQSAKQRLGTLFETWDVAQTEVTFYLVDDYLNEVEWVPNRHYSGKFGLLKLIFPKIIPLEIATKLIVFDTDILLTSDIAELWAFFDKFNERQAIGIVENESDFYLNKGNKPWPALKRGYNTGVLLYDLKKLRRISFDSLWRRVTTDLYPKFGAPPLGDQDIVNAVILQNLEILYQLPCVWNVQLSALTKSRSCYIGNRVKLVHWNSMMRIYVKNRDAEYFRNLFFSMAQLDGNLVKKQLWTCGKDFNVSKSKKDGKCADFDQQNKKYRTMINFRKFNYTVRENDVTLVAQLMYAQLHLLKSMAQYWSGPISVAIYLTDSEFIKCNLFLDNSPELKSRNNIAYHAVFKNGKYFPSNMLRNVALNHVNTPYVFLTEIDVIPKKTLYSLLKDYNLETMNSTKAIIIPAFNINNDINKIPEYKEELLKLVQANESRLLDRFGLIDYEKWKTAKAPYKVNWKINSSPSIAVSSNVSRYDERFVGFDWSRASHMMALEAQDFQWTVLHDGFVVIRNYSSVPFDVKLENSSEQYKQCLENLKELFIEELNTKHRRYFDKNYPTT